MVTPTSPLPAPRLALPRYSANRKGASPFPSPDASALIAPRRSEIPHVPVVPWYGRARRPAPATRISSVPVQSSRIALPRTAHGIVHRVIRKAATGAGLSAHRRVGPHRAANAAALGTRARRTTNAGTDALRATVGATVLLVSNRISYARAADGVQPTGSREPAVSRACALQAAVRHTAHRMAGRIPQA